MQSPKTVSRKKLLNISSLAALVAGGSIALLLLDSLIEQLVGVAIAFVFINLVTYLKAK